LAAHSAAAGRNLARRERPDLVVLDLRLPDGNGFDVCADLVDSPETCDIPVIIVSGLERGDIVRTARKAGCHFFVRKPYDPNALLTLIEHALREAESWRGAP
jgi:DNA-binding response OmpR family regulator